MLEKHFVTFYSPGTFVAETNIEEDEDPQLLYIQNNRLVKRYVQKGK